MTATEQWIFLCAAHKTPREVRESNEIFPGAPPVQKFKAQWSRQFFRLLPGSATAQDIEMEVLLFKKTDHGLYNLQDHLLQP